MYDHDRLPYDLARMDDDGWAALHGIDRMEAAGRRYAVKIAQYQGARLAMARARIAFSASSPWRLSLIGGAPGMRSA
jgi:hypothetical protein